MAIRVAFFDCDGTLTKVKSSWEYLHRKLNIWDNNADHYQALFREGKIDYHEFCRRDALLWMGLPVSLVVDVLKDIPYQEGSFEIIKNLRKRGVYTVILSTGLSLLVEKVKGDLDIDMALSNDLLAENGHLTGEIKINVNYNEKGFLVEKILKEAGVTRAEACAIGDGEGDAGMFEAVGLAIGLHPHESFSGKAHNIKQGQSLLDMLRIVGEYEG
jgi:phosphoserine phosphatase